MLRLSSGLRGLYLDKHKRKEYNNIMEENTNTGISNDGEFYEKNRATRRRRPTVDPWLTKANHAKKKDKSYREKIENYNTLHKVLEILRRTPKEKEQENGDTREDTIEDTREESSGDTSKES